MGSNNMQEIFKLDCVRCKSCKVYDCPEKSKLIRVNDTSISTSNDSISLLVAPQVQKHSSILLWLLVILEGEALPSGSRPLLVEYLSALHYRWKSKNRKIERITHICLKMQGYLW